MIVIRTAGGLSVRFRPRPLVVSAGCAILALAIGVFAIGGGDYPMSSADVLRTLFGGGTVAENLIIHELRLPRLVTALLVGSALGLSGALFQSLARNPLASPDLLGITQGASAGALVAVAVGGSSVALATSAAVGGLATGLVIYVLAWQRGIDGYRLILVGIGLAAILTGVIGYLLTRAQLTDAARAVLWLTGSLDGRGWDDARALLIVLPVLLPLLLIVHGQALRLLEMGDDTASSLGIRVGRLRLLMLGAGVVLASLAAAAAGPISFVALTAPQLARRLSATAGPNLLPSMCVGAVLLVGADLVAQRFFDERQLPVGVLTGVLGGGYLVWLLITERRAGRI